MRLEYQTIITALVISISVMSCGDQTESTAGSTSSNDPVIASESNTINLRANSILDAWSGWVDQRGATAASIAVSYNSEVIAQRGQGRTAADAAPIASLSKAITGLCVAKIVAAGQLSFDTPLQTVVPELASDITIGALLTHTSGLKTDITQNDPATYPGVDQEYLLWVSQQELSTASTIFDNSYAYNNANYAMLGAVISRLTGKSYEQACNELVLVPAGISGAELNPDWRIMSSWGGWKLSAIDYQKFANTYFNSFGVLDQPPSNFPKADLGGGAYYGMGFLFREGGSGGYNFWHSGQWHTDYNGVQYRFGSFFARWDSGWSVAVNHNISLTGQERSELDSLLARAAHQR